jgi:pimeloyl-ACP methyl ester carboxylesterase
VTGEHYADVGRGIRLCFETIGDEGDPPVVLIAGLGQQLISWPTGFCELIADAGFRVIRFDNRDAGRSTHLAARPPSMASVLLGRVRSAPYELGDLAADTVGLLDALGIGAAHLVGASMGGMIAQTVAAQFPDRVRSLTSMMSTTGARRIGRPALSTWVRMAARPPRTREEAAQAEVAIFRHIGSHGFPFDAETVATAGGAAWDRDQTTDGASRQLGAIVASGDRTRELAGVRAPTLVIHGDRDRMVHPSGGLATHRAIAGSRLLTVPGLGHDYPAAAWPTLAEAIVTHARAAEQPVAAKPIRPARRRTNASQ